VENLANTLGYDNAFVVSSIGHCGGLGFFWNNEIKIDLLPYTQYHIDAVVPPLRGALEAYMCVRRGPS
jgi:hypothetical protein